MNQINLANSLEWHDGLFGGLKIECANEITVEISVDLFQGGNERKRVILGFSKVSDLTSSIDGAELRDNRSAGNISNAHIKRTEKSGGYRFYLYLCDGFVGLTFSRLKISGL